MCVCVSPPIVFHCVLFVSLLCPSASSVPPSHFPPLSFHPFCATGSELPIYASSLAVNWLTTSSTVFSGGHFHFFSFYIIFILHYHNCQVCFVFVKCLSHSLSFSLSICLPTFTSFTLHSTHSFTAPDATVPETASFPLNQKNLVF